MLIAYSVGEKLRGLADKLEETGDQAEVVALLRNKDAQPNPVHRLAHALTELMGVTRGRNPAFWLLRL